MIRLFTWILRLGTSGLLIFLALQIAFVAAFSQLWKDDMLARSHNDYAWLIAGAVSCVILAGCLLSCQRILKSILLLLILSIALLFVGEHALNDDELTPQLVAVVLLVGSYTALLAARPRRIRSKGSRGS